MKINQQSEKQLIETLCKTFDGKFSGWRKDVQEAHLTGIPLTSDEPQKSLVTNTSLHPVSKKKKKIQLKLTEFFMENRRQNSRPKLTSRDENESYYASSTISCEVKDSESNQREKLEQGNHAFLMERDGLKRQK